MKELHDCPADEGWPRATGIQTSRVSEQKRLNSTGRNQPCTAENSVKEVRQAAQTAAQHGVERWVQREGNTAISVLTELSQQSMRPKPESEDVWQGRMLEAWVSVNGSCLAHEQGESIKAVQEAAASVALSTLSVAPHHALSEHIAQLAEHTRWNGPAQTHRPDTTFLQGLAPAERSHGCSRAGCTDSANCPPSRILLPPAMPLLLSHASPRSPVQSPTTLSPSPPPSLPSLPAMLHPWGKEVPSCSIRETLLLAPAFFAGGRKLPFTMLLLLGLVPVVRAWDTPQGRKASALDIVDAMVDTGMDVVDTEPGGADVHRLGRLDILRLAHQLDDPFTTKPFVQQGPHEAAREHRSLRRLTGDEAHPSPEPSPSPETSPTKDTTSVIRVTEGEYPSEVSWTLACFDGTSLAGGAPFSGVLDAAIGTSCWLTMTDSYGDGWNGATWSVFGQSFTLHASSGASGTETFGVPALPAPPAPPAPPSLPPSPPSPPSPPALPAVLYSFDTEDPAWSTGATLPDGTPIGEPPLGFGRRSGSTPSRPETGPSSGLKGDGFYYYAEADGSQEGSRYALFYDGSLCLASGLVGRVTFWYHMYAEMFSSTLTNMGRLSVVTGGGQAVWSVTGSRPDAWLFAEAVVDAPSFRFEAVRGSEARSDIAVDDVTMECAHMLRPSGPPPPPLIPLVPLIP